MFNHIKLIIFDLDGTLVDTAPDIANSIDDMLGQLHLPVQGESNVRTWIGNGMDRLIHRALTGSMTSDSDHSLFIQAKPLFLQAYGNHMDKSSVLYATVGDGLKQLHQQGFKLACVTNKPGQFTNPLLKHLAIDCYFNLVVSGETLPSIKPDPAPLLYVCNQLAIDPKWSLMVGDSENDVLAARRAGIPVIGVSYGYNHGQPISSAKPDYVIDIFSELIEIIKSER